MKLSGQAMGALMMALQKSLMEQSDITAMLQKFELEDTDDGLVVLNPPVVRFPNKDGEEELWPEEER